MTLRIQSSETMIDHIGLVGRDIHAMVATFRSLGFTVTEPAPLTQPGPDGEPVPLGQLSAHIIFPDTYVELTAVEHPGQGNHLDNWIAKHEGLHIVALRAKDAHESWRELASHGLVMPPIRHASRDVNAAGVRGTADFTWFQIPESIAKEGFVCVVQHMTPELVFIPGMTDHANGANGLRGVGAVVESQDDAVGRYKRLPGADIRSFMFGRFILLRHQRFVAMTPVGIHALAPGIKMPPPPCFAAFAVQVKSIAATRAMLDERGISYQTSGEFAVWLKPEQACGAVLVFVDESTPI